MTLLKCNTTLSFEPQHGISNDQQELRSACKYAQSDKSLCKSLEYSMTVKLLTGQHYESLSLKRRLHGLVGVYTCQNATLERTCHGSFYSLKISKTKNTLNS